MSDSTPKSKSNPLPLVRGWSIFFLAALLNSSIRNEV